MDQDVHPTSRIRRSVPPDNEVVGCREVVVRFKLDFGKYSYRYRIVFQKESELTSFICYTSRVPK